MYTKKNKRIRQRGGVSEAAIALGRAVHNRSLPDVRRVLEKYPDMDLNEAFPLPSNGYLVLPINDALVGKQYDIVRFLLEKGADVNRASPSGSLPLHMATNADMIQLLLEHGADVNKADGYGETPLHKAVRAGILENVRVLIERGADVNARDRDGFTPVNGNMSIPILNELVTHGADVNTKSNIGMRPIHWAAAYARVEQAKYLLDHGADVNATIDESKKTPLMMSVDAYEGDNVTNPEFIRLLIEYGADETKRDTAHRTVYDYINILSMYNPPMEVKYRKVVADALAERARRANIRSKARTLRNVHLGLNSSVLPRNIVGRIGSTLTGTKITGNIPNTLKTLKKNYNKKE